VNNTTFIFNLPMKSFVFYATVADENTVYDYRIFEQIVKKSKRNKYFCQNYGCVEINMSRSDQLSWKWRQNYAKSAMFFGHFAQSTSSNIWNAANVPSRSLPTFLLIRTWTKCMVHFGFLYLFVLVVVQAFVQLDTVECLLPDQDSCLT
jgi:hypothetical protein